MEAAPTASQAQAGTAGADAGVAQRGPPQPGGGGEQATLPAQHQQPMDANPLRGLGSALERWRANLAVRSDAPEPAQVRLQSIIADGGPGASLTVTLTL